MPSLEPPSRGGGGDVRVLKECSTLVALDLRDNKLRELPPLATCAALRALDVSGNAIAGPALLSALEGLTSLTHLNAQGNPIVSMAHTVSLVRSLPGLRVLSLADPDGGRACPVCSHPSYATQVVAATTSLTMLDGEVLALREEAQNLLLHAEEAAAARSSAPLPPEYSLPWSRDVPKRTYGGSGAPPPDEPAALLLESPATGRAMRELERALAGLKGANRAGGRAVDPVLMMLKKEEEAERGPRGAGGGDGAAATERDGED